VRESVRAEREAPAIFVAAQFEWVTHALVAMSNGVIAAREIDRW